MKTIPIFDHIAALTEILMTAVHTQDFNQTKDLIREKLKKAQQTNDDLDDRARKAGAV